MKCENCNETLFICPVCNSSVFYKNAYVETRRAFGKIPDALYEQKRVSTHLRAIVCNNCKDSMDFEKYSTVRFLYSPPTFEEND